MNKKKYMSIMTGIVISAMTLTGCQTTTTTETILSEEIPKINSETVTTEENVADYAAMIEDIATSQAFTDQAVDEADITAIVNAGINAPSSMNGQPWHFSVITDKEVLEQIAGGMGGGFSFPTSGVTPDIDTSEIENLDGEKPDNLPKGAEFDAGKFDKIPDMTDIDKINPDERPDGASFDGEKPDNLPNMKDFDGEKPDNLPNMKDFDGEMPKTTASSDTSAKASVADAPLAIVISCKSGSELDAGLATQNMSAEAQLLGYGTKIVSSPTMVLNGANKDEYKKTLGIPDDMSAVCVLLIGHTDDEAYDAVTSATTRNDASEVVTYVK